MPVTPGFLPGFVVCKPLSNAPLAYSEGRVQQMFMDKSIDKDLFYELPADVAKTLNCIGQKVDLDHDPSKVVGEIADQFFSCKHRNLWLKLRFYDTELGREARARVAQDYGSVSLTTEENAALGPNNTVLDHEVRCTGIALVPTGGGAREDTFILDRMEAAEFLGNDSTVLDQLVYPGCDKAKVDKHSLAESGQLQSSKWEYAGEFDFGTTFAAAAADTLDVHIGGSSKKIIPGHCVRMKAYRVRRITGTVTATSGVTNMSANAAVSISASSNASAPSASLTTMPPGGENKADLLVLPAQPGGGGGTGVASSGTPGGTSPGNHNGSGANSPPASDRPLSSNPSGRDPEKSPSAEQQSKIQKQWHENVLSLYKALSRVNIPNTEKLELISTLNDLTKEGNDRFAKSLSEQKQLQEKLDEIKKTLKTQDGTHAPTDSDKGLGHRRREPGREQGQERQRHRSRSRVHSTSRSHNRNWSRTRSRSPSETNVERGSPSPSPRARSTDRERRQDLDLSGHTHHRHHHHHHQREPGVSTRNGNWVKQDKNKEFSDFLTRGQSGDTHNEPSGTTSVSGPYSSSMQQFSDLDHSLTNEINRSQTLKLPSELGVNSVSSSFENGMESQAQPPLPPQQQQQQRQQQQQQLQAPPQQQQPGSKRSRYHCRSRSGSASVSRSPSSSPSRSHGESSEQARYHHHHNHHNQQHHHHHHRHYGRDDCKHCSPQGSGRRVHASKQQKTTHDHTSGVDITFYSIPAKRISRDVFASMSFNNNFCNQRGLNPPDVYLVEQSMMKLYFHHRLQPRLGLLRFTAQSVNKGNGIEPEVHLLGIDP